MLLFVENIKHVLTSYEALKSLYHEIFIHYV